MSIQFRMLNKSHEDARWLNVCTRVTTVLIWECLRVIIMYSLEEAANSVSYIMSHEPSVSVLG